jgi:PAS domain S-box-containing protein
MKTPKFRAIYDSPMRLLWLIVATVFVTHTLAMALFAVLPHYSTWVESLVQSLLLLVLLFPVLYLFSLRPLLLNIAERDQAEAVMRESEQKYRQLFESLCDAVFLVDPESGRILDANKQAQALLGYDRGQIMGMNLAKLVPAEKAEETRRRLNSLAQAAGADGFEAGMLDHEGKAHRVNVNGAPLLLYGKTLVVAQVRTREP